MTRLFALLLCLCAVCRTPFCLTGAPLQKPKLVILLVVDQFRYDYLARFRADYKGGIARLLDTGAVFTNAHYEHFPTVTAIGHSTTLSGATPSISGIVGNEWFDRETGKQITSVSDDSAALLGAEGNRRGASPRRLLVSTVADELKMSNGKSKVIGISSKDRSAILTGGRMADGAFWFDTLTGNFVSSTYYFQALPDWAAKFNQSRAVDQWTGKEWRQAGAVGNGPAILTLGTRGEKTYYDRIDSSPYGNDLLAMFAKAAVEGEKLGEDDFTDVLAISFSANDRVGHALGPDSVEVRDISIQTDRTLQELFDYLDKKIGAGNYVTIMTADHGVAPMPEVMVKRKMPGGRIPEGSVLNAVQTALSQKFGPGQWVIGKSGPAPYFNYNIISEKKLAHEDVENVAAQAVRNVPHIYRVYTRSELRAGRVLNDLIDRRVAAGFHRDRGSDLFVVSEPYWLFEARGTSHGTPYNYDSHVPVIFMGPGFKRGRYHARAAVNDIAPTLATLLEVETPSGSSGRVLSEALE
jgi:predicted AlkP superfamily pyrophosphatase or phosphodiesterase